MPGWRARKLDRTGAWLNGEAVALQIDLRAADAATRGERKQRQFIGREAVDPLYVAHHVVHAAGRLTGIVGYGDDAAVGVVDVAGGKSGGRQQRQYTKSQIVTRCRM